MYSVSHSSQMYSFSSSVCKIVRSGMQHSISLNSSIFSHTLEFFAIAVLCCAIPFPHGNCFKQRVQTPQSKCSSLHVLLSKFFTHFLQFCNSDHSPFSSRLFLHAHFLCFYLICPRYVSFLRLDQSQYSHLYFIRSLSLSVMLELQLVLFIFILVNL